MITSYEVSSPGIQINKALAKGWMCSKETSVSFKMQWSWHGFKKYQILTFNIWSANISVRTCPDKKNWVNFFTKNTAFIIDTFYTSYV